MSLFKWLCCFVAFCETELKCNATLDRPKMLESRTALSSACGKDLPKCIQEHQWSIMPGGVISQVKSVVVRIPS